MSRMEIVSQGPPAAALPEIPIPERALLKRMLYPDVPTLGTGWLARFVGRRLGRGKPSPS